MSENRRNSWIAAGLMGLLVWVLTAGAVGAFAALFLGLLTALMLGPTLVWLFSGAAAGGEDRMTFDRWGQSHSAASAAGEAPVREQVMDAGAGGPAGAAAFVASGGNLARPARPAQSSAPDAVRLGAPEEATVNSAEAVTFTASEQSPETDGQAAQGTGGPSPNQAPDPFSTAAPAANDTPASDTRAVMHTPSRSERHDMPGEASPASPPSPSGSRKAERARMAESGEADPEGTGA